MSSGKPTPEQVLGAVKDELVLLRKRLIASPLADTSKQIVQEFDSSGQRAVLIGR